MRLSFNLFSLSPALLLWTLTTINAFSPTLLHTAPQLPFQIPPQVSHDTNGRSWFSHIRDSLIQTIWHIPSENGETKVDCKSSATSGPPSTLIARYGGDLVLRFEINSVEEAEALAEAVNVLFLDVWEFTTEWVDIRLSKDVVSAVRYRIYNQLAANMSFSRFLRCLDSYPLRFSMHTPL